MRFTADRNALAQAVTSAASGVPGAPAVPVRAGMLIAATVGSVAFMGSDGDVTFTATCKADVAETGTVTLPGRLFADVVRSLGDGNVTLTTGGSSALLECGRSKFTFRVLGEEYPALPEPAAPCGVIAGDDFADAVRKTAFAASKADARPEFTSLLLEAGPEALEVVATDRYRLAAVSVKWSPGTWTAQSCLVPAWAAERFTRGVTGDVAVGWDGRVCTLVSGSFEVTARLMAGNFPNWRALMPAEEPEVAVDAEALTAALRRAQLATENDSPVELTFSDGELRVEAAGGSGECSEVLTALYAGEEFRALFGTGNLLDGLGVIPGGCRFGFTASGRPVHVHAGSYRFMVLPRRQV